MKYDISDIICEYSKPKPSDTYSGLHANRAGLKTLVASPRICSLYWTHIYDACFRILPDHRGATPTKLRNASLIYEDIKENDSDFIKRHLYVFLEYLYGRHKIRNVAVSTRC